MQEKLLPARYRLLLFVYNIITKLLYFVRLGNNYFQPGRQRLLPERKPPTGKKVDLWFLCAQSEDVKLLRQIIDKWPSDRSARVLVSTGTHRGMQILDHINPPERVELIAANFPRDEYSVLRKYLNSLKPRAIVHLGNTQPFPNLLLKSKKMDIPCLFLNARISTRQFARCLPLQKLLETIGPEEICTGSEKEYFRFSTLFPHSQVSRMQDIKFDRFLPDSLIPYVHNPLSDYLKAQSQFLVFAQPGEEEEEAVIQSIKKILQQKPKTIIGLFPGDSRRRGTWEEKLRKQDLSWSKRSELRGMVSPGTVLLWDLPGELDAAYALARGVFIGGSTTPSEQEEDFLTPLQQGITPCIGPFVDDHAWLGEEIFTQGLITRVQDNTELEESLLEYLRKTPKRDKTREKFRTYLQGAQGGTESAVQKITSYF